MMGKAFQYPEELDFIRASRLSQKVSDTSLEGKICVITGTTSGIGYQAAIRLAKAGAKLVMMVRDKEKAEQLCETIATISMHPADYFLADFSKLGEVRKAALAILQKYPRVDVLINNTGVHMTTRKLTVDGHETAFAVNHLASFLITSLFLKRMVESAPSRIIQVNSEGHRFNGLRLDDLDWGKRRFNGYGSYGASKTAQLLTVLELDDLLKEKGVTINAMHPGAVKSNIGHNNGLLYNIFSRVFLQPFLKKSDISGDAIYYLASSPDLNGVSGKFFNLTNEEITAPHARDRLMSRKIFELSKIITHINDDAYAV